MGYFLSLQIGIIIVYYRQQLKGGKMIDRFLMGLGLTEEAVKAKKLNGKWLAILKHSGNSGDPLIITVKEETEIVDEEGERTLLSAGDVLAHENPIYVQELVGQLFPEYGETKNLGGKYIQFCHIPKNLYPLASF